MKMNQSTQGSTTVLLEQHCDRWHSFIQSQSKRHLGPWRLQCELLSLSLLADRCVNRYHTARKTPCELWWQPALPLSTPQLSERPRGIRVVIYTLKIVTLPSLMPHLWINDSSILFTSKTILTLVTSAFTPKAVGQDKDIHQKLGSSKLCVYSSVCVFWGIK